MNSLVWLINQLPFNAAKFAFKILSDKLTMAYSNMPQTKSRYNFGGVRVNSMTAFLPAVGEMKCGITAVSHGNTTKIGLISDKNSIQHPDEFMQILERQIFKHIEQSNDFN